jgi:hypothetical protein
MKTKVKVLFFMITMTLLNQCKRDVPDHIIEIPDNNFLNALIELGVDTNRDGIISSSEAEAITYLDVSGTYDIPGEIQKIQGLEAFINLDTLICSYNQISTLNISNNTALISLSCGSNLLAELDISKNTALTELHCRGNQLSALDVPNNIALKILDYDSNELTDLDISVCTSLETLDIHNMPSLNKVCV